jgi:hypothetical protein
MELIKYIFERDGHRRDLNKSPIDFFKPTNDSSPEEYHREQNQWLFFKTLGKDFSKNSHIYPHAYPILTQRIVLMDLDGTCHATALEILEEYQESMDLVFGSIDFYTNGAYAGTYLHSFLIEKKSLSIIDPWMVKYTTLKIANGFNTNHFGVIIPFDTVFDLTLIGLSQKNNYVSTGILEDYIFRKKTRTELIIKKIIEHS